LAAPTPLHPDGPLSLALAVVGSSTAPLVLLDGDLNVIAASASFFKAFQIDPAGAVGASFLDLGDGEWNLPRLRSLLTATLSGAADVDAYEMDLKSDRLGGGAACCSTPICSPMATAPRCGCCWGCRTSPPPRPARS